jgi:hypothetical protein
VQRLPPHSKLPQALVAHGHCGLRRQSVSVDGAFTCLLSNGEIFKSIKLILKGLDGFACSN